MRSRRTARKQVTRPAKKPEGGIAVAPAARRPMMTDLAIAAAIFLLAIAFYYPALHGAFLWDDRTSIEGNPLMRRPGGLWAIWTSYGTIPLEGHFWPVTYTALWLVFQFFGANPAAYHVLNLVLYGAIAVWIWRLMLRMGMPGAWLGALVFALHPVHVESVAWIISVKDLLATLFSLIVVEFFLNHLERGGWKWLAAACLFAALAILSKTTPVTLPIALGLLLWYRDGRVTRRALGQIAILAGLIWVIAAFDTIVSKGLGDPGGIAPPLLLRIVQAGWAFWFYAYKLLLPVNLSPMYEFWNIQPDNIMHWVPLAMIVPVTVTLWMYRGRIGRGPLVCWLFYGITLGPGLGIVHIEFLNNTPAADRYQFMASLAPLAGIGVLTGRYIQNHRAQRVMVHTAVAVVLIAMAALTWRQSSYYRNMKALFTHALEVAPNSLDAKATLGYSEFEDGNKAEAERLLKEVLRENPLNFPAATHLGLVLTDQFRVRETVEVYSNAIELGCTNPDMHSNLAWLLAVTPDPVVFDPERALELAEKAISDPGPIEPRYLTSKAAALAALGRFDEAVQSAKQAQQLARDYNSEKLLKTLDRLIPMFENGQPCIMPVRDPAAK